MAVDNFDLSEADLAIVVESEVPWIPKNVDVSAKVIKVDTDPAHQYIPYYSFPADLSIMSSVDHFFNALVERVGPKDPERILEQRTAEARSKKEEIGRWSKARNKIHPRYLSYEIGKLGMPVLNEYCLNPNYAGFENFGSYFGDLSAGYLGCILFLALDHRPISSFLLLIAGRTPYTDGNVLGSRTSSIHWTQETRDQGEMLRQCTKLDFEIRRAEQIPSSVARAVQLATSEPTGPVYLSFPREVTVERAKNLRMKKASFEPGPAPETIGQAAKLINNSQNPVIITSRAGRKKSWFDSF